MWHQVVRSFRRYNMVDRKELLNDDQEALRMAFDGRLSSLWVSIPGIITKVNFDKMTLEVQPAIQGTIEDQYGKFKNVNLPVLVDVPFIFPSAGGFTLTFPIAIGDEVLVIFASRCIDSWWQSGGIGVPLEQRMHDLSDGFAILGPKSQPNIITNISATNCQLRNNLGDTFLEITPMGKVQIMATSEIDLTAPNIKLISTTEIDVTAPLVKVTSAAEIDLTAPLVKVTSAAEIDLTAPVIKMAGAITVTGALTASGGVTSGSIPFATHKHTGVQTGISQTGGPV